MTADTAAPSLREALEQEEKYLLNHFDSECDIMPGDVEGSFHRLRELLDDTLATLPAPTPSAARAQGEAIVADVERLLELETAAFVSLVENNLPPDVGDLLLRGDPRRSIPPRIMQKAIKHILAALPDAAAIRAASFEEALNNAKEHFERILIHRPGTPGLHYSSEAQLLQSALFEAETGRDAIAAALRDVGRK